MPLVWSVSGRTSYGTSVATNKLYLLLLLLLLLLHTQTHTHTHTSNVERPVKVREHTYTKPQTYCDGRKAEGRVAEEPVGVEGGVHRRLEGHKAK